MQKNRRKLRKEGLDMETIGFAVYEVRGHPNTPHAQQGFIVYNLQPVSETNFGLKKFSVGLKVCVCVALPPFLLFPKQ